MEEEEEDIKKQIIVIGVRAAISIGLLLLGTLWLNEANFPWWVNLIVMLCAYLIIGYDVVYKAFKHAIVDHDFFDECTLMLIASVGAFALRAFGPEHNEYLEGVLVILLYQIGELLEDIASDKSREAITASLDLRKEIVKVEKDGKIIDLTPEEVQIGDLALYGNGMKIAVDGIVRDGSCFVDESSLTGEFVPVSKQVGDEIYSGTILKEGSIKVEVSKQYSDSTVAKLLDMIENNASKKSKATRFITKFSKYYTPIVFVLAILVAVLPPLFMGFDNPSNWSSSIYTALSFLVVSCPCAIVISVPLAYFSGLGLASKNGILVKGAEYFDQLVDAKNVAFDKTGTITLGNFDITQIETSSMEQEEFLEYVSAAESLSSHPIAKAILARGIAFDQSQVQDIQEISGGGVQCLYKGKLVKTGKPAFAGCDNPISSSMGSIVCVSIDNKKEGYLIVSDSIKDSSKQAIDNLHKLGCKTYLISGDREANVKGVCSSLGIDACRFELKPEEKTQVVSEIIKEGDGVTVFVGDGINDAPSIVMADVGVAMGGLGSDVAVKNADVVIMNDNPDKVASAIKIAKITRNRAIFNVVFSLAVKFAVMLISFIAILVPSLELPLYVSVIADSGLAVLMVLSSYLLTFRKVK